MVALENSRLFSQLDRDKLAELKQVARERNFAAGQEIFREGDAGDGVHIVKSGLVEISVCVSAGVRRVFSQINPGDVFGEMAVLDDQPRSASAVACEPTSVYFIPRTSFLKLVEGSPALAMAFTREISNRLREFDRQYLREVLQAERLSVVGRFARSIIHDLKNPLNIIGLTAEVAGMPQTTPEVRRDAVTTIRQQVDRISDLVSEILEFTQGPSGELVLPPSDFAGFVHQIVADLRAEGALKMVTVKLENEPPSLGVILNPKRLSRVFHNIVHNATEAMPGGGRVLLRFERRPTEVVTEIEDTGPGIAPEMEGRLFEPFATFGKVHGTGLGLSICKRIIEDHHGWMAARSEPGRGAVFSFGLPIPREN
jgi:signal transduction histidine kinase